MNSIPFSVGDLKLSVISGVEACMSNSDVKISECYMRFLAPVGKVFPQLEPVCNIFYGRFIRDEDVFLFSYFPLYPSAYRVYAASYFLQSRGNFGVLKSEHHSLAIPIACDDLNQFRPTVHVDQLCQSTHIFVESSSTIPVEIAIPHCELRWCGYDHVKLWETIHIDKTETS